MRYFILTLLFLTGCSTMNIEIHHYNCVIFTGRQSLIKVDGNWRSESEAQHDVETVRRNLIDMGAIGEDSSVGCFIDEDENHPVHTLGNGRI